MTEEQFLDVMKACGFEPNLVEWSKYLNDPLVHHLIEIITKQNEIIERLTSEA